MPSASALVLIAAGALAAGLFLELRRRQLRALLPPGPKPHWLRGNALPARYSWRALADIARQFGGVATVWQGRTPIVVVGSVEAADYLCAHFICRADHAVSRSTPPRLPIALARSSPTKC